MHAKWKDNANFCAAPWACKMKNVWRAPQWENDKLDNNSDEFDLSDSFDDENENTKTIVDINEIKTHVSTPFVAAVELSRLAANIHPKTRWYQNYSVPSGFVNETNFENGAAVKKYEIGDEVSAMEAVNDPVRHEDTRPKFFDSITQTWSLLDTGACVSCIPKGPKDKMDSCFKLSCC